MANCRGQPRQAHADVRRGEPSAPRASRWRSRRGDGARHALFGSCEHGRCWGRESAPIQRTRPTIEAHCRHRGAPVQRVLRQQSPARRPRRCAQATRRSKGEAWGAGAAVEIAGGLTRERGRHARNRVLTGSTP